MFHFIFQQNVSIALPKNILSFVDEQHSTEIVPAKQRLQIISFKSNCLFISPYDSFPNPHPGFYQKNSLDVPSYPTYYDVIRSELIGDAAKPDWLAVDRRTASHEVTPVISIDVGSSNKQLYTDLKQAALSITFSQQINKVKNSLSSLRKLLINKICSLLPLFTVLVFDSTLCFLERRW